MSNWYDVNWTFKEDYFAVIGERWDQISVNAYGRPDLYHIILEANMDLSEENRRGLSIVTKCNLKIPDLDLSQFDSFNLPEWRQAANATT